MGRARVILILMILSSGYLSVGLLVEHPNHTVVMYEIYYVDAPFGRLYGDAHGRWTLLGGSLSTAPSEAYTIKYWRDGELKTMVVDATSKRTHVLVDGTLSFQVDYISSICWSLLLACKTYDLDQDYPIEIYIHLPSLPQVETQ